MKRLLIVCSLSTLFIVGCSNDTTNEKVTLNEDLEAVTISSQIKLEFIKAEMDDIQNMYMGNIAETNFIDEELMFMESLVSEMNNQFERLELYLMRTYGEYEVLGEITDESANNMECSFINIVDSINNYNEYINEFNEKVLNSEAYSDDLFYDLYSLEFDERDLNKDGQLCKK
jgi:hypothetical protein